MTMLAGYRRAPSADRARRSDAERRLRFIMLASIAIGAGALAFVGCALWPRWPDAPIAADAPALPIVVAGVPFNVPPQAIRVAVQRRAGAQERIDLVFAWPALAPPAPGADVPLGERDRVFLTIAASDALAPLDRLKTIYPRYTAGAPSPAAAGLALVAFRDGTPFEGEDLAYDPDAPEKFLARCTRPGNPLTPATCLAERRIGRADLTLRFPRDWLNTWRDVEAGFDALIGRLRAERSSG
jgi:hypothetical protein